MSDEHRGANSAHGDRTLAYVDEAWRASVDVNQAAPAVGDRVSFTKSLSDEDVREFAAASGDTNRLHLDDAYAAETRFGGRIVHGALLGGLISAALARLPGVVIYLSQELSFVKPVRVGDEPTATVEIVEALGGNRFRLAVEVVRDDGEQALEGTAVVLVESSLTTEE